MQENSPSQAGAAPGADVLLSLRDRITMRMGFIGAAIILPFSLLHLVQGRTLLGTVDFWAALMLAGNAWALSARRRPLLPYPLLVLTLIVAVLASAKFIGSSALVWVFPASLFAYMALPRRLAHAACAVMTLGVAAIAALTMTPDISLRFVAAALLMLVLLNVVLGVIGELQRALVQQAVTDPLTGAYNRRHLHDLLARIADDPAAPPHALVTFDIDHFKAVNDRHGHAGGDAVLRAVVETVRGRVRATDMLFRVGGEEFVLLLPDTGPGQASGVAEELRRLIEQTPVLPGEHVTVSVGVCARPGRVDGDCWLRAADDAMYQAKRGGRNRVAVAP